MSPTKKCLLAVTMFGKLFQSVIGQNTTFFDPGVNADKCNEVGISHLNAIVEQEDPFVIYIQTPFTTDTTGSEGYDKLKNFAEHQEQAGRTCIVADAMHTTRWNSSSSAMEILHLNAVTHQLPKSCLNGRGRETMATLVVPMVWKIRNSQTSSAK